jgi:predicted RNase H-like nuclease
MSGGTFDYRENVLDDIATEIDCRLASYMDIHASMKPETRRRLKKLSRQLFKLYMQVRAVDYYFACDIGEDSLLKALKEK